MLYFLTSNNSAELQQKSGQEFNQIFSKINLIATTPKGFAVLVLCGAALSLLTFFIGFASGWAVVTETNNKLAAVTVYDAPPTLPPAPADEKAPDPVVPPYALARKPGITPGQTLPDKLPDGNPALPSERSIPPAPADVEPPSSRPPVIPPS